MFINIQFKQMQNKVKETVLTVRCPKMDTVHGAKLHPYDKPELTGLTCNNFVT